MSENKVIPPGVQRILFVLYATVVEGAVIIVRNYGALLICPTAAKLAGFVQVDMCTAVDPNSFNLFISMLIRYGELPFGVGLFIIGFKFRNSLFRFNSDKRAAGLELKIKK